MKILTYNMLHNKRSTRNWSLILDKYDPDIVLAQESLPPEAYRQPLLDETNWQRHAVWSPVNSTWGSAVYVKAETPRQLKLPKFPGWVIGVEVNAANWLPNNTNLNAALVCLACWNPGSQKPFHERFLEQGLFYLVVRRTQKCIGRESPAAMQRAVC